MNYRSMAFASAASVFLVGTANAAVYDFTGGGGLIGKSAVFNDGPESVEAIAINTEEPGSPQLHQNGLGLGVRLSSGEGLSLTVGANELDNVGDDEAIVIDLGLGVGVASMTLSEASFFDDYRIYGSNNDLVAAITSGGLSAITSISTLIASGGGVGIGGSVVVNFDPFATVYRYLIATIPGGSGDGYRVAGLTTSESPLPGALPFMAPALAGGALARRRRLAAAA